MNPYDNSPYNAMNVYYYNMQKDKNNFYARGYNNNTIKTKPLKLNSESKIVKRHSIVSSIME